jgi:hypothetical protein
MRNSNKSRSLTLFALTAVLLAVTSCSKGQVSGVKIMDRITALKEFKTEEKRIDSLKRTGLKVDITISIIDTSFDPADKGKAYLDSLHQ